MLRFDEIIDDEMVIRERLKMAAKEAAAESLGTGPNGRLSCMWI